MDSQSKSKNSDPASRSSDDKDDTISMNTDSLAGTVSSTTDNEQARTNLTESEDHLEPEASKELTEDQSESFEDISEEQIQRLSHHLMDLFLPNLELAKKSLHELTQNQKILIETVQQENAKFDECSSREKLADILSNAKVYHGKLLCIKKQMLLLQDKSLKLKKRALRLQQQKQKEELQRAQQQEYELEKEQMLEAKVIPKP
ncbi:biogenesis of lysosome-related organelles complex 1 subunit 6-like [Argonauta hians]